MATLVANSPVLPALSKALETQDFQRSRQAYNELRDDADQPPVTDDHIQNLARLFVRHNAHKVLGVHLVHGHFKILESTVLLGTNLEEPKGRWARVTPVEKIDPATIHGHIFVFTKDAMCAYEYQDGPMPDLSGVGEGFLNEFVDYLVANNLTDLLGLQVLTARGEQSMSELILDNGTIMLDTSVIKGCTPYRITGWSFEVAHGNPRVCHSKETHAKVASGAHKVFNAVSPIPKLENVEDLKFALAGQGIL
ncbi:hypothetical protein CEP54_008650 [Fusarium duplospermum]|uniref:Uncharacterized protein n=1 Tax=Fusarium duplospermum TaxID=1325734 RepID=A0A428PUT6_9HYPO|nr:hypothetical protein CEP54_008650 [Fusarium duplospermum]